MAHSTSDNAKAGHTTGRTLPAGEAPVEVHPFEPFLPAQARLLMLGTFPPSPRRWCMDWYYPNYTNDMWRIMGLCFFGDRLRFVDEAHKTYRLDDVKAFMAETGIAVYDTCRQVRRTTGTASDKDLQVVEPTDLDELLRALPHCCGVLTAGQLATSLFAGHYGIDMRKMQMGDHRDFCFGGRTVSLYRMPSTSRAFPMRLEQKAAYYKTMFEDLGLMQP